MLELRQKIDNLETSVVVNETINLELNIWEETAEIVDNAVDKSLTLTFIELKTLNKVLNKLFN